MIAMTMAVVLRLLNNFCAPEKLTLIEWHLGDPRVLSTVRVAAVSGEEQARPSKGERSEYKPGCRRARRGPLLDRHG
jgi:hypothetical protein